MIGSRNVVVLPNLVWVHTMRSRLARITSIVSSGLELVLCSCFSWRLHRWEEEVCRHKIFPFSGEHFCLTFDIDGLALVEVNSWPKGVHPIVLLAMWPLPALPALVGNQAVVTTSCTCSCGPCDPPCCTSCTSLKSHSLEPCVLSYLHFVLKWGWVQLWDILCPSSLHYFLQIILITARFQL